MGILELMLGNPDRGEQGVEGRSYKLPKETHDFVYPIAVRRDELEAFVELLEAEADAPALEENTDELQDVFDEVLGESEIDAAELAETQRAPRERTEAIIDRWTEQVTDDFGVVYARADTHPTLVSFVKRCKRRDEDDDDPFDLPEAFSPGMALLKRLDTATENKYRALVHTDLLPDEP